MRTILVVMAAIAAVVAVSSCSDGAERVPWQIKFAESATAAETAVVVASIFEGGCPGAGTSRIVYQEQVVLDGGEAVLRPPKLGPGTYGFAGLARDGTCARIAEGCIEVTLPLGGDPGETADGAAADGSNGPGGFDGGGAGPGAGSADGGADDGTVCVVLADRTRRADCDGADCSGGVCPVPDGGFGLEGDARVGDGSTDAAQDGPRDTGPDAPSDAGRDAPASCPAGFGECDGDPSEPCETPLDSLSHCGACNETCAIPHASEACEDRICRFLECEQGWDNCDADETANGCETNVLTDPLNCGACGGNPPCVQDHRLYRCLSGACDFEMPLECEPGWADCAAEVDGGTGDGGTGDGGAGDGGAGDGGAVSGGAGTGCETPITTPENCGGCGVTCMLDNVVTHGCDGGTCSIVQCADGFADCDGMASTGCEVDLMNDPTHCGDCDTDCTPHATATCSGGTCTIVGCDSSWGDCNDDPTDGCEVDLSTGPDHCGICDRMCDTSRVCCIRQGDTTANCNPSGQCP